MSQGIVLFVLNSISLTSIMSNKNFMTCQSHGKVCFKSNDVGLVLYQSKYVKSLSVTQSLREMLTKP